MLYTERYLGGQICFICSFVVSSNPYVGPSPRTKIFFSLSKCIDELLSASKIIAFLPQVEFGNEKCERESNLIPYPE